MEIHINNYTIQPNGNVLKDGVIIKGYLNNGIENYFFIEELRPLQFIIAKHLFFKECIYLMDYVNVSHINKIISDNSFTNIKIYPKSDRKNKSNNFISIYDERPSVFINGQFNRFVYDLREDLKNL